MFKIGQKIVAKDLSSTIGSTEGIKKGQIYEIESIGSCSAGQILGLVGVDSGKPHHCLCGGQHASNVYMAWRFEPLKYAIISNKHFIKEIITERSDSPIKRTVLN